MAHSFVQCHEEELSAFRSFATAWPNDCILLVDTYDTLRCGVPNAIVVAKGLEKKGCRLKGIRLDSGDLAYLSKQSRAQLDGAGLHYAKIAVSNQLDEYVIRSMLAQGAPIDIFGVGTSLVTGHPDAALDGVYKMVSARGNPVIKISENVSKITLPGIKQVWRAFDHQGGLLGADAVGLYGEKTIPLMHHSYIPRRSFALEGYATEPLLRLVMDRGAIVNDPPGRAQTAAYCRERLSLLPDEYKRFENPHIYKVGISSRLKALRDQLIEQHICP